MKAILGKKVGMTQVYENDKAVPVTVILAGPCFVSQVKSTDGKDGYNALQLAFDENRKIAKPQEGHLKGIGKLKFLREIRIKDQLSKNTNTEAEAAEKEKDFKKGEKVTVSVFEKGDNIQVTGISKGRGFSGVIKRHGFARGPMAHGSDHHREPGSIGSRYPQRVIKGRKLPGHFGVDKVTVKNLKVVEIDETNNLLVVSGAVPGANGGYLVIRQA